MVLVSVPGNCCPTLGLKNPDRINSGLFRSPFSIHHSSFILNSTTLQHTQTSLRLVLSTTPALPLVQAENDEPISSIQLPTLDATSGCCSGPRNRYPAQPTTTSSSSPVVAVVLIPHGQALIVTTGNQKCRQAIRHMYIERGSSRALEAAQCWFHKVPQSRLSDTQDADSCK